MTGVRGKTGTHGNRSNQWMAGTVERSRTDEVFAFKPKLSVIDLIKQDIEQRQVTKTEWLDMAVESFLGGGEGEKAEETELDNPLVQDAIATSIELKRTAISREKKAKRPDEEAIARWQSQIEELEAWL
jgi:hypothetical protein